MANIRPAVIADIDDIVEMTRAVSRHEGSPPPKTDHGTFKKFGFGKTPAFECCVAEDQGQIVGHISWTRSFDFQDGCPVIWIADMFVKDHARRQGIGRKLVGAACRCGLQNGAGYIQWITAPDNDVAARFYASLGARKDAGLPLFLDPGCMRALSQV